jgi:hypothetical protein
MLFTFVSRAWNALIKAQSHFIRGIAHISGWDRVVSSEELSHFFAGIEAFLL